MIKSGIAQFERNLDWNLLKIFHEIVRCRGVSRAATHLLRRQPSISASLKKLEDCVGATLCCRGPSGFDLTSEGEIVAEFAARVFGECSELPTRLQLAGAEARGVLRICLVHNLVSTTLDVALAAFVRRSSDVEVIITNALLPEVESSVLEGRADIGVAPVVKSHPDLVYNFLYREQHRPFCGRSHHLFGHTVSQCDQLADEPFVLPDVEEADVIRAYRHRHGWGRRQAARSPHLSEVKRMVVAGLGIGFLPQEMLEADVSAGHLWPLMAPRPEAQADVLVISNRIVRCTPVTARFLSVLAHTAEMSEMSHASSRTGRKASRGRRPIELPVRPAAGELGSVATTLIHQALLEPRAERKSEDGIAGPPPAVQNTSRPATLHGRC